MKLYFSWAPGLKRKSGHIWVCYCFFFIIFLCKPTSPPDCPPSLNWRASQSNADISDTTFPIPHRVLGSSTQLSLWRSSYPMSRWVNYSYYRTDETQSSGRHPWTWEVLPGVGLQPRALLLLVWSVRADWVACPPWIACHRSALCER